MDPTWEIFAALFFRHCDLWSLCRCEAMGLIFSEEGYARAREVEGGRRKGRNIFHCVIPSEATRARVWTRRTRDRREIPALGDPFWRPARGERQGGEGVARLVSLGDATVGLTFRGLRPRLTKPGLNLSRAFVDPLARRLGGLAWPLRRAGPPPKRIFLRY